MSDKLMLDLLKEVRVDQKKQGEEQTKQGVCLNILQKDCSEMKTTIAKNTANLAEHMSRTVRLEEKDEDKQERLEKLEEGPKAKAWFKKNIKNLLIILGAAATVISKIAGLW